jgi:hypothetical protein
LRSFSLACALLRTSVIQSFGFHTAWRRIALFCGKKFPDRRTDREKLVVVLVPLGSSVGLARARGVVQASYLCNSADKTKSSGRQALPVLSVYIAQQPRR